MPQNRRRASSGSQSDQSDQSAARKDRVPRPSLAEIQHLVVEAHTRALGILREHRAILDAVARQLMDREVVEGAEVRALIEQPSSTSQAARPQEEEDEAT